MTNPETTTPNPEPAPGAGAANGLTTGRAGEAVVLARPWMEAFISTLRTMPNVTSACRVAGVSRPIAYKWRHEDEVFRVAWEDALEQSYDALEVFAHRMASTGLEAGETRRTVRRELRYPLNPDGTPNLAGEQRLVTVEETEVTIENRLVSPSMTMFLLRAHRPAKFTPPTRHEHGGPGGGPVPVVREIYRPLDRERALELARMALELEAGPPDVEGRVAPNGNGE